jgi:transcriptional regulator with XRE-family HTH domain
VSPTRQDWTLPSLYAYRLERALSQAELAKRSGVGVNTILRLEQGYPARPSTVRKLAQTLGVEPADLMAEPE